MKFTCPLIVVEDMGISRKFYEEVLGQKVILDFGANITFAGDFSLQTRKTWAEFISKREEDIKTEANNFELYFEEEDFDTFAASLRKMDVHYLRASTVTPGSDLHCLSFRNPGYLRLLRLQISAKLLPFVDHCRYNNQLCGIIWKK